MPALDLLEDWLGSAHDGNLFAISRLRGWDWTGVTDFSSNVNPLGFPAGVPAAIEAAIPRIAYYPDAALPDLSQALAKHYFVDPDYLLPGNGGTELLHFFARTAWQGPVAIAVPAATGLLQAFPRALKVPWDQPERWPQRGLLVFSQPNMVTGQAWPQNELRSLLASREGPVLIDESSIEFTELDSLVSWTTTHPNLVVLRSLTRFFGLPGLRVGALISGPEWAARLRRQREPWQVGVLAEAAACAAVEDEGFVARTRELVRTEREWMLERMADWPGVEVLPTAANYFFARIQAKASDVYQALLDRKILIRTWTGIPGVEGEAIGFSIRTRAENERLIAAGNDLFCER